MEGQITIFDYLKDLEHRETEKPKELNHVGDWIDRHGKRVMFADVKIGGYYIADYSAYSRKCYKIVYVKKKTDDSVMYVDRPKGVTSEWSWGNSFSAMTRQEYMDVERNNTDIGMFDTAGWWYEVPEDMEIDKPAEIYPVDIEVKE